MTGSAILLWRRRGAARLIRSEAEKLSKRLPVCAFWLMLLAGVSALGLGVTALAAPESVNVYEALRACSQYLEAFGGHAQAAGVTVRKENFEALRAAMNRYVRETYAREDFLPSFSVCAHEAPDLELAKELERLERENLLKEK